MSTIQLLMCHVCPITQILGKAFPQQLALERNCPLGPHLIHKSASHSSIDTVPCLLDSGPRHTVAKCDLSLYLFAVLEGVPGALCM